MSAPGPLKLRAEDKADLEVIAACLQDAVVAVRDMRFLPGERRFAFIANRFRWEGALPGPEETRLQERVLCGVVFDAVEGARSRGIGGQGEALFLDLLSIAVAPAEPGPGGQAITLTFAGGAAVRLEAERIQGRVEDLTEPWPTLWRPAHE